MDENVARIEGNVRKMIEMGAPEKDIDAYLSSENMTTETFRAAVAPKTETPAPAAPKAAPKPFGVLPMREDPDGSFHFDLRQGLTGALMDIIGFSGQAMRGNVNWDTPEAKVKALEAAALGVGANPGIRAGDRIIPGEAMASRYSKPAIVPKPPTADALKRAADEGYDAVRATGAEYPASSFANTVEEALQRAINESGFVAENAPKTSAVLAKLRTPPEGSTITISGLDAARRALGDITPPKPGDSRTDYAAAQRFMEVIDDFIARRGEAPSVAGTAPASGAGGANGAGALGFVADDPAMLGAREQAATLLPEARGNAAARFRSDRITGIEDAAMLRADAANSGQNIGNALRQRLIPILTDPAKRRGFSEEELSAIRQVVEGTASTNTLRYVGNLFGGGGGLGQLLSGAGGGLAGGAVGGIEGAAIGLLPAVTGATAKAGENMLTSRQVRLVDELVRSRSPLAEALMRQAPSPNVRGTIPQEMLLRALLSEAGSEP